MKYFHLDDVEDFLWRSNSDNLISVGRDERLIHSPISSAIQSEKIVPLSSFNVTSTGSVCVSTPNMHNEYVHSLCDEQKIPFRTSNLRKFYSQKTMSKFLKWNKSIKGESIVRMRPDGLYDNSLEIFYEFARRWSFGNGDKSLLTLADVCDRNGLVAEELNRPDLKATWQVIKMIYIKDERILENYRKYSTKTSRSFSKIYGINDLMSSNRFYRRTSGRKLINFDDDHNGELTDDETLKLQDQRNRSNSKLGKNTNIYQK